MCSAVCVRTSGTTKGGATLGGHIWVSVFANDDIVSYSVYSRSLKPPLDIQNSISNLVQ